MAPSTTGADGKARAPSIHAARVRTVLDRLHAEAGGQTLRLVGLGAAMARDKLLGRTSSVEREVERLRHLYVPVSRKQGELLYLVARSLRATRVVEFGTSFGISTTYLAAAVKDNGGGLVIGSELEPNKVATARRNLEDAGLAELVEIREGDAQETLRDPGGAVDMVLLDGFKELYLPMLKLLTPHLRQGAVVLGDNIFTFWRALAPYVAYVRNPENGFFSVTLFLGDGTEYSVRLGCCSSPGGSASPASPPPWASRAPSSATVPTGSRETRSISARASTSRLSSCSAARISPPSAVLPWLSGSC
jgi:predicted O-methyltransferase YrrM